MQCKTFTIVALMAAVATSACVPASTTTQVNHRLGTISGGGGGEDRQRGANTSGGGREAAQDKDAWSESDLVDDRGNVEVASNEVEVAPTDSSGGAPPALGTPAEDQ